eukprot:symbB.v1.2.036664.t1/scaffold5225.1/size29642/3
MHWQTRSDCCERIHNTGASNRAASWAPHEGPIDFDANMRSTMPIKMHFKIDTQVPSLATGTGNQDFSPKLPGHDYRQPRSDPRETARIRKETKAKEAAEAQATFDSTIPTLTRAGISQDLAMSPTRSQKKKAPKPAPRWKARSWYEAPHYVQGPLQRDEGETWNSMESHKIQGEIKGKDRLMRTVRRPEDVGTPDSEAKGRNHPLYFDKEEYYPGRSLIDAEPDNDFPVRPAHLPDFYNPPPLDADSVSRVHRIREVVRQRYAGRPRLMNVFRACSMQKPGYVFPRDLKRVFDQMGIKVNDQECDVLAVDRDRKGAITYEEFADLIYGPRLAVGDSPQEAQERHVRFITKKLVDNLLSNGQALGKAFCEIDPERHYAVGKDQFANAISTACNHISHQAVEFLWASQFPGQEDQSLDNKVIDWRDFMGQLAHFAHNNRAPTPCTVQGRKRQYDLLQRTAPLTGGRLEDLELNRPDQNADDEVQIVAGNLCHRATDLPHRPRDAAMLTEHYVEEQLEVLGAESAAALTDGFSAMSLGSQEPRLPAGGRFTVMMFGMTGSGKSALGNLLAGYDHFQSGDDTASVTNNQSVLKYEAPDRSLVVLDTIGLGDTEIDQDKVVASIRDSALSAPHGVDAMLFVMRSGRITDDVIARLIYATEYLWGADCLLNLYIVVTYASRYVTQRDEAMTWIERQTELNWRFRHIYSLVGQNENRILFVDNPDPADGEPLTSRQNIIKALVNHPRDVIPPFTHAMMKKAWVRRCETAFDGVCLWSKAQERMEATLAEVKNAEDAITQLEAKAAEAPNQEEMEREMKEAKARKRKAEEAYKQEMKNIQEDEEFRRMAAQAVEEATAAFGKKYECADPKAIDSDRISSPSFKDDSKTTNPIEACKRVFRALRRRFVKPKIGSQTLGTLATPSLPTPAKSPMVLERLTPDQVEASIEEVHVLLAQSELQPQQLFSSLDQQGLKSLTPVQFQIWVRKVCPHINPTQARAARKAVSFSQPNRFLQVGGIWRRVDTNCDGKVSEEEFLKFMNYKKS